MSYDYFITVQTHVHFGFGHDGLVERRHRVKTYFGMSQCQMIDVNASSFETHQTFITLELRTFVLQHYFRCFLKFNRYIKRMAYQNVYNLKYLKYHKFAVITNTTAMQFVVKNETINFSAHSFID